MAAAAPQYLTADRIALIESNARELQRDVWKSVWARNPPRDLVEALEPGVALNFLGYNVTSVTSLGEFNDDGVRREIAGVIDRLDRRVSISMRFDEIQRRFTTGHELGHAVMQPNGKAVHRDRPLSGPLPWRSIEEVEADRFSSAYLISAKQLIEEFEVRFGAAPLELNDLTLFNLLGSTAPHVVARLRTERDLSGYLASATNFGGRFFGSLLAKFRVSRMAMAIRLEELELVNTQE